MVDVAATVFLHEAKQTLAVFNLSVTFSRIVDLLDCDECDIAIQEVARV